MNVLGKPEVFCGWGDGPDVGINFFVDGKDPASSLAGADLTVKEALAMAEQLLRAAQRALELQAETEVALLTAAETPNSEQG